MKTIAITPGNGPLLSLGQGSGATRPPSIRWLRNRVYRKEAPTLRGLAYRLAADMSWPVRALGQSLASARRHGRAVAAESGISTGRQFLQQWALASRHRLGPDAYYKYKLYRPHNRREAAHYMHPWVSERLTQFLYRSISCDIGLLVDKSRFHRECLRHQLPTAPTVAEFVAGAPRNWRGTAPGTLPREDLFSKPAGGICGKGVAVWRAIGPGLYRGPAGESLTQGQLIEHLCRLSRKQPYLLQPRLRNHPLVAPLSPGGLCTIRIVTYRMPGGPAEILATIFRMPTGDSPADNFARGGLASVIDGATGRLRPAVRKAPEHGGGTLTHHPDTGREIEGFRLPFWDQIRQLCLTAQERFDAFPSVGWDVAITEQGPLLVEGNHDWCVDLVQQSYEQPLGLTAFTDHYLAHVGDRI